jgi:serine/threonine protein kinase
MSGLKIGTSVRLSNGETAVVKSRLASGGQGVIYLVKVGMKKMALKWYLRHPGKAFLKNLMDNVRRGAPAPNFIWPLAVTEEVMGSFGYVMELRPKGYEDMSRFILLKAKFADVHAQLNACLQICTAFQKLHIHGLSYQDMNDGNFFIDPKTGDVLICDNDNVAPDKTSMGVLGKAGYMAPEIVEGVSMPDRYTDYYSLAVCLFILIYMNRPFEGAWNLSCPCDNNPEMARQLFGFGSVFIMDPNDRKNRPVPGMHNNVIRRWNVYPSFLGRAFCKTFSAEAIKDPTQRLMDKQWYNILLRCGRCSPGVLIVEMKRLWMC